MKLRNKYILFTVMLHLICLVLTFFIFEKNRELFILAEVLIIVSIVISIGLYKELIKPLTYLREGINAIKDRDFSVKFLLTGRKEVDGLIAVYNQMIDELRAERTRQEEQHFFLEKLIQTSPTGIIVLDYDNTIKKSNPKAEKILARFPDLLNGQLDAVKIGTSDMVRADGQHTFKVQRSHFMDRGFKRVFIMLEEVTEEIFQAEKNVYSKVIRMMAHEVNNTIGPVNSILSSGLQTRSLWEDNAQMLLKDAFQIAIDRNQNLNIFMKSLADLVKLNQANIKTVDLNNILAPVVAFMGFKAKEKNILIEYIETTPYLLEADALQLEQAFINIIKNSVEAIENNGNVKVTLNAKLNLLTISDNGKGIAAEIDKEIFSPFFSTKKDGQGIGLLLVREILVNHGYQFNLKTTKPGQTDFTVKFS